MLCAGLARDAGTLSAYQLPEVRSPQALGLYNWLHTTADAEMSFAFYRDVLGIELSRNGHQSSARVLSRAPGL
jgi:hypothetical protein